MFNRMFFLWSCALHTAPTFLCKESRQRYTKNLLVFGFPAEGGPPFDPPQRRIELVEILKGNDCQGCFLLKLERCPAPFDPPMVLETFVIDEGERDRFAVTAGAKPGYLRGNPLDTLLLSFLVKEKEVPVWAA